MARTRYPRRTSISARWEPMNPSAPVMATSSLMGFPPLVVRMATSGPRGGLAGLAGVPRRATKHQGRVPGEPDEQRGAGQKLRGDAATAAPGLDGKRHGAAGQRDRPAAEGLQQQRGEHGAAD